MTDSPAKRKFPVLKFRAAIAAASLALFLAGSGALLYARAASSAAEGSVDVAAAVRRLASEKKYLAKIYVTDGGIVARGTGRIAGNAAQARLLARRAALADARRNLVEFRSDFLRDPAGKGAPRAVSGRVGRHGLLSAGVDGDTYRVEIEIALDEWLASEAYE
ncbi:MAG: hypothetical protein LBQ36_01630 [Synergistaceae bacterium]|nr:hypothetical protein [Synergistaceae bacterium]